MNQVNNRKLRVVADEAIPFLQGILEPFCEVSYLRGGDISHEALMDLGAEALLIRTRTVCDRRLLEGSAVSFIATATIGTDHMDLDCLAELGIAWANAPGCNACGVMQHVHTALFAVAAGKGLSLKDKCIGVIGAGMTGERVARLAEQLGFRVLRNDIDPRLSCLITPIEELLSEADIVSLHLPLDASTRGLVSTDFLRRLKEGAILINTCRGEVIDSEALLRQRSKLSALILDVWEGEPSSIDVRLLAAADLATPHIAGYSHEGKLKGTAMSVRSLARHFGLAALQDFDFSYDGLHDISALLGPQALSSSETVSHLAGVLQEIYPIREMDAALRARPTDFEDLRRHYRYRHEFSVPAYIADLPGRLR